MVHYLTQASLTTVLRDLLQLAGHDSSKFASHSFRRGAATTAAAVGVPSWLIQDLGRWASDCYKRYIECPEAVLLPVASSLAAVEQVTLASWNPESMEAQ